MSTSQKLFSEFLGTALKWRQNPMSDITIFHNPDCGTGRNTPALIRHAGIEPRVVEYLNAPPSREQLRQLLSEMKVPVRQPLREKGTSEAVLELLPVAKLEPFKKEDGELVVDDGARRA